MPHIYKINVCIHGVFFCVCVCVCACVYVVCVCCVCVLCVCVHVVYANIDVIAWEGSLLFVHALTHFATRHQQQLHYAGSFAFLGR